MVYLLLSLDLSSCIYLFIYVLSLVFLFTSRVSVSSSISFLCASLTFSFNSYFLSCFSLLFIFHILMCSLFLARSSFCFVIISSLFMFTVFIPSYPSGSNLYSRWAAPRATPSVMQRIVTEVVREKTSIKECFLLSLRLFGSAPN